MSRPHPAPCHETAPAQLEKAAAMVKLTDRRRLGSSDVTLPPIGFGCAPLAEIYDR